MKTISGKVVSSNPISLSKAAKIMSGFAAVDNGASDAVRMYLKRTSDAFNNLVQFHKELKTQISHRKGNGSQPNVSAVKTETLADTGEIPEEKKVHKRKKNRDLEASQLVNVKIVEKRNQIGLNNEGAEEIDQGANESSGRKEKKKDKKERKQNVEIEEKRDQIGLNNEGAEVIDQGANESSGKKEKKKDKKERKQNEESLSIVQSSDGHVKGEKIEYLDARKESDGSGVKRDKKKRKRSEDEVVEKSLEEDVKAANVGEAVDEGKQDGKKKRKKRKI